jgi:ribosomal protein S18 acetylase RimI-like enzyme
MLLSDPWKKMGFTPKDVRGVIKKSKKAIPVCAFVKNQKGREQFAGFALLIPDVLGGYYLHLLAVDSNLRGMGIGEKLIKFCEAYVFERSKNFYLFVSSFNKGGIKFYKKLGFEKVGIFKELVIKGHDELFFRKTTGPWRSPKRL